MNQLENLIGAARLFLSIQQGETYVETKPTGLLDPDTSDAPEVVVNLYNQCRTDKALVKNSDALVTLFEIDSGATEATRAYWKHSKAFNQTLNRLEKALTPLPDTPLKVKLIITDLTLILKESDVYSKGITESLVEMKAEVDALAGKAAVA